MRTLVFIVLIAITGACSHGGQKRVLLVAEPSPSATPADNTPTCAAPAGSPHEVVLNLGPDENAGYEARLKVGDVLVVTSRSPGGLVIAVGQPWTPKPDDYIPGLSSPHMVICRFSPREADAPVTRAKFLAVAPGQTFLGSGWDFAPTPSPTGTPACCGGGNAGGVYRADVFVTK